jgi:hypothetical protein
MNDATFAEYSEGHSHGNRDFNALSDYRPGSPSPWSQGYCDGWTMAAEQADKASTRSPAGGGGRASSTAQHLATRGLRPEVGPFLKGNELLARASELRGEAQ